MVYDRRSKVKPWLDSIVYQLINIFGSVKHRTAQAACNFVYLFRKNLIYFEEAIFHSPTGSALLCIQPIIVADSSAIIIDQSNLGNSCGLYLFFSSVTNTGSLIFIEPGTIQRADVSPARSDISRYTPVFFPLRIDNFHCFLLRHPMNFNCFFRHFNCVNTQIRSLIRVLHMTSLLFSG